MSNWQQTIQDEVKQAMRNKETLKLNTLRMLKAAYQELQIAKGEAPNDEDVLALIRKQVKQRKEAAEEFAKNGRQESADKETEEAGILEAFLPAQMDDAELETLIQSTVADLGLESKKDFGRAMGALRDKVQGRADNKRISDQLNRILK